MKIITEWIAFEANSLGAHWRRNGDIAEIRLIWVGKDFDNQYDAMADAQQNASTDSILLRFINDHYRRVYVETTFDKLLVIEYTASTQMGRPT